MAYDLDMFTEQAAVAAQARPFDQYVLPAFMIWFAWASKKPMGRWTRRILFTAGVYAVYRNLGLYREALATARTAITAPEETV